MIDPLASHRLLPPTPERTAPARDPRVPTPPSSAPTASGPPDLSPAEARMIDTFFPPSPVLHLRLYGPGSAKQDLNPAALGHRLDVRG